MAQAARAYPYSYPERVREAPRPARQRVRVVPGQRPRTATEALPSAAIFLAKTVAVVLVVLTMLGFARIALNTAAVSTSLASQELTSELAGARSSGSTLEVQQSTLSNPTRVKTAAGEIKMNAPRTVTTVVLGQDVVATDESGNLSFAESVRRASGTSLQG